MEETETSTYLGSEKMTGEVKIMCCQGISKDKKYDFYPYWRIKLIGDDGKEAEATITYPQLIEVFKKILMHEFCVDRSRKRNPDFVKWKKAFAQLENYKQQLELAYFNIPKIYTDFISMNHEKEIKL